MANKEIKELEIRVETTGVKNAKDKIRQLNAEFDKAQRKINRASSGYRKKGSLPPGTSVAAPYMSSKQIGDARKAEAHRRQIANMSVARARQEAKALEIARRAQSKYSKAAGVKKSSNTRDMTYRHWWEDTLRGNEQSQKDVIRNAKAQEKARAQAAKMAERTRAQEAKVAERNRVKASREEERNRVKAARDAERTRRIEERAGIASDRAASGKRYAKGRMQSDAAKARGRTSMKAYRKRISDEANVYKRSRKVLGDAPMTIRNSVGSLGQTLTQAVGELTMFAGAISMVGFMAHSAFTKMMAVGDMFATVEGKYFVGAGYREGLGRKGRSGFDRATALQSRLTGQNKYSAAQNLARIGSQITSMGGVAGEGSLSNIALAAVGTAALTGETSDKMMSKILEVAKKGKGADKIGLGQLKLTRNINDNLDIIANAVKSNPIASTAINQGTVGAAMTRVRESFGLLGGNVFGEHSRQIRDVFSRVGDIFEQVLGGAQSTKAWSKTLTNLTQTLENTITPERLERASMGAAKWGAELVTIGGHMVNGAMWFLENSETVLSAISAFAKVWVAINALKLGVGMWKLYSDVFEVLKAAKAIGGLSEAGKVAGGAAVAPKLVGGFLRRLALPFAFFTNSTEVGSGEEDLLNQYNKNKATVLGGGDIFESLGLKNGQSPVGTSIGRAMTNAPVYMPGYGHLYDSSQPKPQNIWGTPNSKIIVVEGDINLDQSVLSKSDERMIQGAGAIN